MTRRQSYNTDLLAKLNAITVANGYLTNLGPNIKHWGRRVKPKDSGTVADFRDLSNNHNERNGHYELLDYELYIAYKTNAQSESTVYTTLTNYIQDVLKCLYDNEDFFYSKYDYTEFIPQEESIDIELADEWIAEATIRFSAVHKVDEKWILDKTVYS